MLTTSGSMWFRNGATDSVNMAITKSGFIGIGTKTPDASLHIAANDSKVELLVGDAVMRGDDGASRIMIGNTDAHSFLRAGQDTTLGLSVGWRYNADTSLAFGQITTFNNAVSPLVLQSTGGKVGIGSTAPAAKLDVLGNIKIADGTQAAGRVLTSDASGLATWAAPPASIGWSQSGNNISNTNIGNVGIGTTQPSQSLLMVSTNTS